MLPISLLPLLRDAHLRCHRRHDGCCRLLPPLYHYAISLPPVDAMSRACRDTPLFSSCSHALFAVVLHASAAADATLHCCAAGLLITPPRRHFMRHATPFRCLRAAIAH